MTAESKWDPAHDLDDPADMIAVTRFHLDDGYRLTDDGMLPCVRMIVTGRPDSAELDTTTAAATSLKFVMSRADARAMASRILETTERKRPKPR